MRTRQTGELEFQQRLLEKFCRTSAAVIEMEVIPDLQSSSIDKISAIFDEQNLAFLSLFEEVSVLKEGQDDDVDRVLQGSKLSDVSGLNDENIRMKAKCENWESRLEMSRMEHAKMTEEFSAGKLLESENFQELEEDRKGCGEKRPVWSMLWSN